MTAVPNFDHRLRQFCSRAALSAVGLTFALSAGTDVCATQADDWQKLNAEGENALAANNYGQAERSFLNALKEADKGGPSKKQATTLHNLANLHLARGQFAKAEPYLEKELRVKEKCLGGDHPDVVNQVGKLTQFYLNHGSSLKAERMSALLLTFGHKRLTELNKLHDDFKHLAGFYKSHAGFGDAQTLLKQLETVSDRTFANHYLELAVTLDSLGSIYKERQKQALAEQMFKCALNLRERALPDDHMALATSCENLANLYSSQGKTSLAEPFYKQALSITEKTLQPGRPEVFQRLDSLGRTYLSLGHNSEAESLYKRGITILEQSSGPGNKDLGSTSLALANLYIKQGRFAESEPLLKRALKISEGVNGPQHASVAPILDTYADVLDKLNRSSDASKLRNRAKTIRGTSIAQEGQHEADF